MMTQQTLTQLRSLKLSGMADALQQQLTQPSMSAMSFEERIALLVDREVASRDDRRRTRLLSLARLKYPQATIEDVDTRLAEELRVLHGAGGFGKWLLQLAKTDVLILDDWALAPLDAGTRADLLEVIDDRAGSKGTIITSQLPVKSGISI